MADHKDINIGDMVYWTLGVHRKTPIEFATGEPFLGVVTKKAKRGLGIEVYWLNNGVFKLMNSDVLILAANYSVKKQENN